LRSHGNGGADSVFKELQRIGQEDPKHENKSKGLAQSYETAAEKENTKEGIKKPTE